RGLPSHDFAPLSPRHAARAAACGVRRERRARSALAGGDAGEATAQCRSRAHLRVLSGRGPRQRPAREHHRLRRTHGGIPGEMPRRALRALGQGARLDRRAAMKGAAMHDPDGKRLPIKIDTTCNGEFTPVPLSAHNLLGNQLAHEAAAANAKRLGLTRRRFLVSACGAASTLIAFNQANATRGGYFDLPPEAALDEALAQAAVGAKREFIFDVQGHFVDPSGAWAKKASPNAFSFAPKSACGKPPLECLGADEFIKDVFRDSDTDMMVLSFVP